MSVPSLPLHPSLRSDLSFLFFSFFPVYPPPTLIQPQPQPILSLSSPRNSLFDLHATLSIYYLSTPYPTYPTPTFLPITPHHLTPYQHKRTLLTPSYPAQAHSACPAQHETHLHQPYRRGFHSRGYGSHRAQEDESEIPPADTTSTILQVFMRDGTGVGCNEADMGDVDWGLRRWICRTGKGTRTEVRKNEDWLERTILGIPSLFATLHLGITQVVGRIRSQLIFRTEKPRVFRSRHCLT